MQAATSSVSQDKKNKNLQKQVTIHHQTFVDHGTGSLTLVGFPREETPGLQLHWLWGSLVYNPHAVLLLYFRPRIMRVFRRGDQRSSQMASNYIFPQRRDRQNIKGMIKRQLNSSLIVVIYTCLIFIWIYGPRSTGLRPSCDEKTWFIWRISINISLSVYHYFPLGRF